MTVHNLRQNLTPVS